MERFVTVAYGYPTSDLAERYGRPRDGVWVIRLLASGSWKVLQEHGPYADREIAEIAAHITWPSVNWSPTYVGCRMRHHWREEERAAREATPEIVEAEREAHAEEQARLIRGAMLKP